jgi:superfamily I DNA/RNA helicase
MPDNEWRVYGPPGTGKTTWLSRQIEKAAYEHGSDKVMAVSFTKAAAVELAGRKLPLDRDQVGTLHAICYRALGSPELADKHLDEWNAFCPTFALSGAPMKGSPMEEPDYEFRGQTDGDRIRAMLDLRRGALEGASLLSTSERAFMQKWTDWKRAAGYMDFTDLLEVALTDFSTAPGRPEVIFADEAQDLNPLMTAILRKWGARAEYFVLVGDDDQTLYRFIGASPEAFLATNIPPERERILKQSYRVPKAVQAWAERWIAQASRRAPKVYLPRGFEGEVRHAEFGYESPGLWMLDAEKYLDAGKTVMVLTACGYQLESFKGFLRQEGIPFHNPYRRSNGSWNPIRLGGSGTSGVERLQAFLRPENDLWPDGGHPWTIADVAKWIECIQITGSGIQRGAKSRFREITKLDPGRIVSLAEIFEPGNEVVERAFLHGELEERLGWFKDNLGGEFRKSLVYPIAILEKQGSYALTEKPKVVIGTIHSVKGGEADVVYLFPDLSSAGAAEWESLGEKRDSIIRQFYVGATRARESLILGTQSGARYVPFAV